MTFKAVGANVFAGGFTLGVEKHFEVVAHLDHDGYGEDIAKLNWPNIPRYSFFEDWPIDWMSRAGIDFIYANPPCAPFSVASHGRSCSWNEDPRLNRIYDIFGLLETVGPRALAIESVVPSWTKGRAMWDELAKRAARLGYSFTVLLHDAVWLSVPQKRPRAFFIFHNILLDLQSPAFDRIVTVREALSKKRPVKRPRPVVSDWYIKLASQTPPGQCLKDTFEVIVPEEDRVVKGGKTVGRPFNSIRRIPIDSPMNVFMGAGKVWHHTENRPVTIEEAEALVCFPSAFKWPSHISYNSIMDYISRGVSPSVGSWLASQVSASLLSGRAVNYRKMDLVDFRKPPGSRVELTSFE